MYPPVPISKKSCDVALHVLILTVILPVSADCKPACSVILLPAALLALAASPAPAYVSLMLYLSVKLIIPNCVLVALSVTT